MQLQLKKVTFHPLRFAALAVAFFGVKYAQSVSKVFTEGPVICPFRLLTGLPCPFCGTTRGMIALSEGHIVQSLAFNPFALVTALGLVSLIFIPTKLTFAFVAEKIDLVFKSKYFLVFLFIAVANWIFKLALLLA